MFCVYLDLKVISNRFVKSCMSIVPVCHRSQSCNSIVDIVQRTLGSEDDILDFVDDFSFGLG